MIDPLNQQLSQASHIPVVLLTGFLGSGKTSLLSSVLATKSLQNTVVLINEYGAEGLDGDLVSYASDDLVETTTGCLCCTVSGSIRESLLGFAEMARTGSRVIERVIVETTGLADPARVIHTLLSDPELFKLFALHAVITTIDALHGEAALDRRLECVKQITSADILVMTKSDIVEDEISQREFEGLKDRVRKLNPVATVLDGAVPDAIELLVEMIGSSEPHRLQTQPQGSQGTSCEDPKHYAHHSAADSDIRTSVLRFDEPPDTSELDLALERLCADHHDQLLRIKGLICDRAAAEQPRLIQIVGPHRMPDKALDHWPNSGRNSFLVFISQGLDAQLVESYFPMSFLQTGALADG